MILTYTDALPGYAHAPRPYKSYVSAANKMALDTTKATVDKIAAAAYVIVMCVNDIADASLRDAVDALKGTQYYKHNIKRTCKMCLSKYDEVSKRMEHALHERFQFWMDFADEYSAIMQPHIDKLYWSIKMLLDRNFETDSSVKARLCTAEFMLSAAARNFKGYFDAQVERYGLDVRKWFSEADLTNILHLWSKVCDVVLARTSPNCKPIDIAGDPTCHLAGKCIANMMLSSEVINAAGKAAILANPEVVPEGVDIDEYSKIL